MTAQPLAGTYGQPLTLDACFGCSVVWFDGHESLLLAPGAILELFGLIHRHRGERRGAPLAGPACPRCRARLVATTDRQRHVQFRYWRCASEHGRLTTFTEFLREKDFVRPLAPAELAELKAKVKTVRCDGCGAGVELARGSTCGYCRVPVSTLDPEHVERVVRALETAERKRKTVDPTLPARLAMDRMAVDRFFQRIERESGRGTPVGAGLDLVDAGIGAIVDMLTASGD
jgi:hypothetical protein